jgi:hypothetical protein
LAELGCSNSPNGLTAKTFVEPHGTATHVVLTRKASIKPSSRFRLDWLISTQ